MVQARQPVLDQHADNGGEHGSQYRQLESRQDERGPRRERPPADVERIRDHVRVPLHEQPAESAGRAADQREPRDARRLIPDRVGEALKRERAEGVELPVAGLPHPSGRGEKIVAVREFQKQRARIIRLRHVAPPPAHRAALP